MVVPGWKLRHCNTPFKDTHGGPCSMCVLPHSGDIRSMNFCPGVNEVVRLLVQVTPHFFIQKQGKAKSRTGD